MIFRLPSVLALVPALALLGGCAGDVPSPHHNATAQARVSSAAQEAANPALAEARRKVRAIEWEIVNKESERRRLSPPIRHTDSNGTTFDVEKQRQYEHEQHRLDREIHALRAEKTVWELHANHLNY